MDATTREYVDTWWAALLGMTAADVWSAVTITHPHGTLGDYPGWFVAWREEGVHVSAPITATPEQVARIRAHPATRLGTANFWKEFADETSSQMIGPSAHLYLDRDPGVPETVEQVDPVRLQLLRPHVSEEEWAESEIGDVVEDGGVALGSWGTPGRQPNSWVPVLQGAAVLTEHAGGLRDVGILVASDMRGRGVGRDLGRAAASYAVDWHGWARWTARMDNAASLRLAASIGFEPYVTQLAITPAE